MDRSVPNTTRDVYLREEPTELCKILKFENLVATGGEAKGVISEGHVIVNGVVETRKRKKIVSGDVITFHNVTLHIVKQPSDTPRS